MLSIVLTTLFTGIALAAVVSLTDSAIKWRNAFRAMKAEMALGTPSGTSSCDAVVVTLHAGTKVADRPTPPVTTAPLAIAA